MAARGCTFAALPAALLFLAILCLSIFPTEVASKNEASGKTGSANNNEVKKEDSEEKQDDSSTPKPPNASTPACACPTPEPQPESDSTEEGSNGFGAGSIFLSILFGMGLMFSLTQLYAYWEKRRLGDVSNYPGY